MKIWVNNVIPFHGYCAMTIWPFILVRKEYEEKLKESGKWTIMLNHERIHGRQQVEMLVVPFFIWYIFEWILRNFFGHGNAYRNISFEREAYANEDDKEYLENRPFWAFLKYLKKK